MERVLVLTLEHLKPHEYEFDVETPDGETITFTFRAPSQADIWRIDRNEPEPQKPFKQYAKLPGDVVVPAYDEDAYQQLMMDRIQIIMYKKILQCWVDAPDILGTGDLNEQIEAMRGLSAWAVSALWKITQMMIAIEGGAIERRPFRRVGASNHDAVRPEELDT